MVKDGAVKTPRSGVLEGITRKVAMEICTKHDIPVIETNISLEEFLEADEVFATTTGGGTVSITRVNDRIFSNDVPGDVTRRLNQTYWEWHNDPAMSEPVNADH